MSCCILDTDDDIGHEEVQFDFLINNEFLQDNVQEHMENKKISTVSLLSIILLDEAKHNMKNYANRGGTYVNQSCTPYWTEIVAIV